MYRFHVLSARLLLLAVALPACLVAPSFGADSVAESAVAGYQVGVAKVEITPSYPVRLTGYGNRTAEATEVEQPLFAKALAIRSGDAPPVVLVTVDTLGVSAAMTEAVAARLQKEIDLPRANASTWSAWGPCASIASYAPVAKTSGSEPRTARQRHDHVRPEPPPSGSRLLGHKAARPGLHAGPPALRRPALAHPSIG